MQVQHCILAFAVLLEPGWLGLERSGSVSRWFGWKGGKSLRDNVAKRRARSSVAFKPKLRIALEVHAMNDWMMFFGIYCVAIAILAIRKHTILEARHSLQVLLIALKPTANRIRGFLMWYSGSTPASKYDSPLDIYQSRI
jgi:hypothetical protein